MAPTYHSMNTSRGKSWSYGYSPRITPNPGGYFRSFESFQLLKSYDAKIMARVLFLDAREMFELKHFTSMNHVDSVDSPKSTGWHPSIT